MSLNVIKLGLQLLEATSIFHAQDKSADAKLPNALTKFESTDPSIVETKRLSSARTLTWLAASIPHDLKGRFRAPDAPLDYAVIGVDGSHVDADRNMPVHCYLINIGSCDITYGHHAQAQLESTPFLFSREEDFRFGNPDFPLEATPVDSTILGLKRSLMELETTVSLIEQHHNTNPIVGLLDGTLIYWTLMNSDLHTHTREHAIAQQLLPPLDRLQELSKSRDVALASYISLPMAKDIVNLLRVSECPFDTANCGYHCGQQVPGSRGCDSVDGLLDRDIFQAYLRPFERSSIYYSTSAVSTLHYKDHQVAFFYIHAGQEVARVEIPGWIGKDMGKVDLIHSVIVEQIIKGQGYPVSLSEAHEQAVVRTSDRDTFQTLIRNSLETNTFNPMESQKQRSKRTRWV